MLTKHSFSDLVEVDFCCTLEILEGKMLFEITTRPHHCSRLFVNMMSDCNKNLAYSFKRHICAAFTNSPIVSRESENQMGLVFKIYLWNYIVKETLSCCARTLQREVYKKIEGRNRIGSFKMYSRYVKLTYT